jgi:hypothetical protein
MKRPVRFYVKDVIHWFLFKKTRNRWGSLYRMGRVAYIFARNNTMSHLLFIMDRVALDGYKRKNYFHLWRLSHVFARST